MNTEKYYIYAICFDNGKFYVGKTKNYTQRMKQHHNNAFKHNLTTKLYKAMKKHIYITLILEICNSSNEIANKEKYWIKKLNCVDKGYNSTIGGDGVINHTKKAKLKMKKAKEGMYFGLDNPRANEKEFYKTTPTLRSNFILSCNIKGWNVEDFKEIYSNKTYKHGEKLYYYVYEPLNKNKEKWWLYNSLEYKIKQFGQVPCLVGLFKQFCNTHKLDINKFEKIFSNQYYISPKGVRLKKYFFIEKLEN